MTDEQSDVTPMRPIGEVAAKFLEGWAFTAGGRALFEANRQRQQEANRRWARWKRDGHLEPGESIPEPVKLSELWDGSERTVSGAPQPGAHCQLCGDVRWVYHDLPVDHPDYGRAFPCRCQTENPEVRQQRYALAVKRAGLPEGHERFRLDNYQPHADAAAAYEAAKSLVQAVRHYDPAQPPRWLVLYGDTGRGKTHLLCATVKALIWYGQAAMWETVPEFLNACKADNFAKQDEYMRLASVAPVLALDEFGSHLDRSDWARGILETVLGRRYQARLVTLVGATFRPPELQLWSARLHSRFHDPEYATPFVLAGGDYRQRKGESNGRA